MVFQKGEIIKRKIYYFKPYEKNIPVCRIWAKTKNQEEEEGVLINNILAFNVFLKQPFMRIDGRN